MTSHGKDGARPQSTLAPAKPQTARRKAPRRAIVSTQRPSGSKSATAGKLYASTTHSSTLGGTTKKCPRVGRATLVILRSTLAMNTAKPAARITHHRVITNLPSDQIQWHFISRATL